LDRRKYDHHGEAITWGALSDAAQHGTFRLLPR
jgi:hypothetical protein